MKIDRMRVSMFDLLMCLTNAGDLISREVTSHHQQVAYLAFRIGEQLGLSMQQRKDLVLAGLVHDIGAFSLDERLAIIEGEPPSIHDHAHRGARLIQDFKPLVEVSHIIRYHHLPWEQGEGQMIKGKEVSYLSHILHLADRIAVLVDPNSNVLDQVERIKMEIVAKKGSIFEPDAVDAFLVISINDYIWLDVSYQSLLHILPSVLAFDTMDLDIDEVIDLTQILARIIDLRSPFTANHSVGVAKTAEKLAQLVGYSDTECKMMLIAGYLHDLGKLVVSKDILHKRGKIDKEERNIIRSHTYYTYRLLENIKGFEIINKWASFHHEKLNGQGYPFRLSAENIPLGSRIMAVADVFTAITEDRPYRKGMSLEQARAVLDSMVADESLCPRVVVLLKEHIHEVNAVRKEAQRTVVNYNSDDVAV
jgi:putative nucleotidyltransferase with HDIG domain